MKKIFCILLFLTSFTLQAAPSSIDSLGLPEKPETRYDLDEVENIDREERVWYEFYTSYTENGEEVKHGLWMERERSRDRERHDTDYVEVRKIYYQGEVSTHSVVSTWVNGVLRERNYILSEELNVLIKYNAQGQEIMGPKANARGGRAKRERITRIFNEVYQINN
ncbi:hypothetical protein P3T73_06805 [Kiritimatiellota bacterium B12222]|nr:hypothetical protein P3T73_06805 [Kiritimatiellota bacterium B12222]